MATQILICSNGTVDGNALLEECNPGLDVELLAQDLDEQTAARLAGELKPDIIIINTTLPEFDAKATFGRILRDSPNTRIIALSEAHVHRDITILIVAGAQAYLPGHPKIGELRDAVEAVINNGIYISPRLADTAGPGRTDSYSHSAASAVDAITARERDVLKLLANGNRTRQIAKELSVSEKTIEAHRRSIMVKLDLHNIADLTKYALRTNIISLDT